MGKVLTSRLPFLSMILAMALTLTATSACSNVGCTENQNSLPQATFLAYPSGAAIIPDSIEIGGVGAPADTLLYTLADRSNLVYLPFRSTASETAFYIRYKQKALDFDELVDTITFRYDSTPYFSSEDCGAMYHYLITYYRYTKHLIDSVAVTDSLITNIDRTSIEIYFRVAPDDDGDAEDIQ